MFSSEVEPEARTCVQADHLRDDPRDEERGTREGRKEGKPCKVHLVEVTAVGHLDLVLSSAL